MVTSHMMNTKELQQISDRSYTGLISLWAFGECGIGGVLHGLHLPLTGIFVGSISAICIVLIGYIYGRNSILYSLLLIVVIKASISPHSPWQAYVALGFQGILGYLLFDQGSWEKWRFTLFFVLTMFESSAQKVGISLLIFGNDFFTAIDRWSFQTIGIFKHSTRLAFLIYIGVHVAVGLFLSWWISSLWKRIEHLPVLPIAEPLIEVEKLSSRRWVKGSYLMIAVSMIITCFLLPESQRWAVLLRIVVLSAVVSFVLPRIFAYVLSYYFRDSKYEKTAKEIVQLLPSNLHKMKILYHQVSQVEKGWNRFDLFLLYVLKDISSPKSYP